MSSTVISNRAICGSGLLWLHDGVLRSINPDAL
jgi:hypothetical protein